MQQAFKEVSSKLMEETNEEKLFAKHIRLVFKGGRHCSSYTVRCNCTIGAQGADIDGVGGCALITEFQLVNKAEISCRRKQVIQLILNSLQRCKIPVICCGAKSIISLTPRGDPPPYAHLLETTLRRARLPAYLLNLILDYVGVLWFVQRQGHELPRNVDEYFAYSIKVSNKTLFRKIVPYPVTVVEFPYTRSPLYLEWSDDLAYIWVRGRSVAPVICLIRWVRKRMKIPPMVIEIGGLGSVIV